MHIAKLVNNTRAYSELLHNHIMKEDQVLYPMSEQALSDEAKDIINQKYQAVEAKLNKEMDIEALKFI